MEFDFCVSLWTKVKNVTTTGGKYDIYSIDCVSHFEKTKFAPLTLPRKHIGSVEWISLCAVCAVFSDPK